MSSSVTPAVAETNSAGGNTGDPRAGATDAGFSRRRTLLETIEGHANNYTLIRLILAASVIWYHSFGMTLDQSHADRITGAIYPITTVGGLAVQCFFFLSGLFVALSFFRDQSTVGFIAKRGLRIWPGLFVCVTLTAIAVTIGSHGLDAWRYLLQPDFYDYIGNNARLKLTWEIPGVLAGNRSPTVNGPIHTLPLEVKMYVVLGVAGLLRLLRTQLRIVLVSAALLLLVLLRPITFTEPFDVVGYGQAPIAMFFAGMLAFGVASKLRIAAWHGLPLIALFWLSSGVVHTLAFYLIAIWTMLFLGQWTALQRWIRPREDPSYGIYIYGWPCQQLVLLAKPDMNPYLLMICALALAWACALVSWRTVEKPAITFARALAKRWKSRDQATAWHKPWPVGWRLVASLFVLAGVVRLGYTLSNRIDALPQVEMATRIVEFGPHVTRAGETINELPNGDSALWLVLDSTPPANTKVVFDGETLDSQVGDKLITAYVPPRLLAWRGGKKIQLKLRHLDRVEVSNTVEMRVTL